MYGAANEPEASELRVLTYAYTYCKPCLSPLGALSQRLSVPTLRLA